MQALVSGLILVVVFGAVAAGACFLAVRLFAATRAGAPPSSEGPPDA